MSQQVEGVPSVWPQSAAEAEPQPSTRQSLEPSQVTTTQQRLAGRSQPLHPATASSCKPSSPSPRQEFHMQFAQLTCPSECHTAGCFVWTGRPHGRGGTSAAGRRLPRSSSGSSSAAGLPLWSRLAPIDLPRAGRQLLSLSPPLLPGVSGPPANGTSRSPPPPVLRHHSRPTADLPSLPANKASRRLLHPMVSI